MEWITAIRKSVEYIEEHLKDDIAAQDVAEQVYLSSLHFQRGFLVMTGYSVSEYIRSRRLYLAALDLTRTERTVTDIAFDYCYETSESFTKAFTRFHGSTPTQIRQGGSINQYFLLLIYMFFKIYTAVYVLKYLHYRNTKLL